MPTTTQTFTWPYGATQRCMVIGNWDNWKRPILMAKTAEDSDIYTVTVDIEEPESGKIEYKFIVDENWNYDLMQPTTKDFKGNVNNVIVLREVSDEDSTKDDHVNTKRGLLKSLFRPSQKPVEKTESQFISLKRKLSRRNPTRASNETLTNNEQKDQETKQLKSKSILKRVKSVFVH